VSGLGSDQFDGSDKEERLQMTNFFNWFFFFISIGSLGAVTVLVYIQDNLGRDWGYGICACAIVLGLVVFLSGTRRYRFKKLAGSPLTQIAAVFVAAWRKRNLELPSDSSLLFNVNDIQDEEPWKKEQRLPHTKQFRLVVNYYTLSTSTNCTNCFSISLTLFLSCLTTIKKLIVSPFENI
jgi:hypothetical protein